MRTIAAVMLLVLSVTAAGASDADQVKSVIAAVRAGRLDDADASAKPIKDPTYWKLAQWLILRADTVAPRPERFRAFLIGSPDWPHRRLFEYRASGTRPPAPVIDAWVARRLRVRELLDARDYRGAYQLTVDTPAPRAENHRIDWDFTAGWIALRYLGSPGLAEAHFDRMARDTVNPHALARAGYWLGRTADALLNFDMARKYREDAAAYPSTYYGQLARTYIGLPMTVPPLPRPDKESSIGMREVLQGVGLLYELNEPEVVSMICAELGESSSDAAGLLALSKLAIENRDGRSLLLLGKGAYSRGLSFDRYAFPQFGLPQYTPIAKPIPPELTYAIARTESHFSQKVLSTAKAVGLMQVTAAAGEDTARRARVIYDWNRLVNDSQYNMAMGAAELSFLLTEYKGDLLLTAAGYNAGRTRVRQWIAAYGDPRDPKVDRTDWVERIPISETRNYLQRITESVAVYKYLMEGN